MNVTLTEKIKNYKGEESETEDWRSLLVGAIQELPEEQLDPQEKIRIYVLSTKLFSQDEIELKLDDLSFIKERAGKTLNSFGYGRICDRFDAENEKK